MSKVTFGLWYDFRNPPDTGRPFEAFYRDCLDQIARAEQQGFGSVWLTEHHFCDDGYTPSPLVIAAAIGARTRRLRIGTNLITLPIHNPVRVAEDAATLSLLTGGRFDLGIALGYRALEFEAFGRDLKHRPSLMEEGVEIIRRGWSGQPVNLSGKRFTVGDLRILPAPEHPPRLLMGGMSEAAIDRAARLGDGFLSTGGIGHELYVAALERHGTPPERRAICAGSWAIIAPDPHAEAERLAPHILYQTNQYISWGAFGPPGSLPLYSDARLAVEQGLYELWDADTAVARLSAMIEAFPQIADIHFWAMFPGEPVASGQRRIDYIADKVLPRLR
jgi:alkanesulfonate monooxygenase SsuD/methylene tetrahydromethanopterin reductase-like flavin-dependent oxidoreductase (luciferase family)